MIIVPKGKIGRFRLKKALDYFLKIASSDFWYSALKTKGLFEQKPIKLILPEEILEENCKDYLTEPNSTSKVCVFAYNRDCGNSENKCNGFGKGKIEIPLNELITFVCGECEGEGKRYYANQNEGGQYVGHYLEKCKTCSEIGKIKLKVLEKVEFEKVLIEGVTTIHTHGKEMEYDLTKNLPFGNYVYLEGEIEL